MTSREFFYLVSQMRQAQKDYFKLRDQHVLRRARLFENQVDAEIARVKVILSEYEKLNENVDDGMLN